MTIPVTCQVCHARLRAPRAAAGRQLRCPRCNTTVLIAASVKQGSDPAVPSLDQQQPDLPSIPSANPWQAIDLASDDTGGDRTQSRTRRRRTRSMILTICAIVILFSICGGIGLLLIHIYRVGGQVIQSADDIAMMEIHAKDRLEVYLNKLLAVPDSEQAVRLEHMERFQKDVGLPVSPWLPRRYVIKQVRHLQDFTFEYEVILYFRSRSSDLEFDKTFRARVAGQASTAGRPPDRWSIDLVAAK